MRRFTPAWLWSWIMSERDVLWFGYRLLRAYGNGRAKSAWWAVRLRLQEAA